MKFSLKCKKQWFDLFISPHAALRSYLQQNKLIKIMYARIFEPIQGFELRPLVDAHVPFNGGLRTRPTEPESQKQKVSRGVGAHNFCTHTNKRAQEKRRGAECVWVLRVLDEKLIFPREHSGFSHCAVWKLLSQSGLDWWEDDGDITSHVWIQSLEFFCH